MPGTKLPGLAERRIRSGISVQQLARRAHITDAEVERLERSPAACTASVLGTILGALAPEVEISASAAASGETGHVELSTVTPHAFQPGDIVTIRDHSADALNGQHVVITSIRDTFTVKAPTAPSAPRGSEKTEKTKKVSTQTGSGGWVALHADTLGAASLG